MRITREALLSIVRDTVTQKTRSDRSLLSIYMCGSLLEKDFLLGGATDIDLVFIHTDLIRAEREIIHLTEEIHLDISHHQHKDYRQTRSLRTHPWLGPTLAKCKILYDPQHFMDFTQASVRGQFDRADFTLARARSQAEHARQIWQFFHAEHPQPGVAEVLAYLKAVDHAANAIASLSGQPLTERRYLLNFPARAEAVGRPGLYPGLLGLLGAPNVDLDTLQAWLPVWRAAYDALPVDQVPIRLHPLRRSYYLLALEEILVGEQPLAVLWPLLHTWTLIVQALPEGAPERRAWQQAFNVLELVGPGFMQRIAALDAYLDLVEETLDQWAQDNGA